MNLRARLAKIDKALDPAPSANPLHGLAVRIRGREKAHRTPSGEPRVGSLAWRMRQRGSREAVADLV